MFSANLISMYEVRLSDLARAALVSLARIDRHRGKALALLVMSLEKNPKPKDSRELHPEGLDATGERNLEHSGFSIIYHVNDVKKVVFIAGIRSIDASPNDAP